MANVKWSSFTSGGNMQVGDQTVGLRSGNNYRFAFPSTGINDSNGNPLIGWSSAGAGATNYVNFTNSTSGNPALIESVGGDVSVGLTITSQGNGDIVITPGGIGSVSIPLNPLYLNTSAPSVALQAASKGYVDSLMPTYPISLALGGTNANLTASNGGIFYSSSTAGAILSGTATARQMLQSGSSTAPAWSTATWPATTTGNQILYSSSNNTIAGLTTANNGVLVTSNTGVPSLLAGSGVNNNMLMSNSAAAPSWSTATYANTYAINNLLYASSASTVTGLATANSSSLVTDGSGNVSWSQTLPSAVQGNITSLGTITSGIWHGTAIGGQYGGTGVNNGASTITIGGSVTYSGAFTFTGTLTGTTSVTFPTSGTLATTSQLPANPLPLSQGGTNANLTASNGGIFYSTASAGAILSGTATASQVLLSGSNTTPAWSTATYPATTTINQLLYSSSTNTIVGLATSATAVLTTSSSVPTWAAQLSLALGGTNANLTASNGGIFYSSSTAGAILSGTATARQMLQSGASTTPAWSTTTWPATTTISRILYSSSASVIGEITTANSAVLVTNVSGVPSFSGTMINGQLIIGNTSGTPTAATLTAGTGVSITNGSGTITIASTASGFAIVNQASSSVTMVAETAYYINNGASLVTLTLPASAAQGDTYRIIGGSAGGWKMAQASGQTTHVSGSATTTTTGTLASANQYDCADITCITANTTFVVLGQQSIGLTIV